MQPILENIAECIQRGKISASSPYPKDLIGLPGVKELVAEALTDKLPVADILEKGLIAGMEVIGEKFRQQKIFIPEVMIAAKAMHAGVQQLQPYFDSGSINYRGRIITATVQGDLHDIGKNILAMFLRGAGWQVIDLGVNVSTAKIVEEAINSKVNAVCLSALLTTTMLSMENTVNELRAVAPEIKILVGGAPVSEAFAQSIGADFYSPSPQLAITYLASL